MRRDRILLAEILEAGELILVLVESRSASDFEIDLDVLATTARDDLGSFLEAVRSVRDQGQGAPDSR